MHPIQIIKPIFVLTIVACAGAVYGEESSCMIVVKFGANAEARQCLQNNGMEKGKFEEFCNIGFQNQYADESKVFFVSQCPVQLKGACENAYGRSITAYFYDAPSPNIKELLSSDNCEGMGGHWKGNSPSL